MNPSAVGRTVIISALTAAALVFPSSRGAAASHLGTPAVPAARAAIAPAHPSLAFEPNRGQTDSRVRYLAHGPGYTLFLTNQGAELSLTQAPRHQAMRLPQQRAIPMTQPASRKQAVLELLPQEGESPRPDHRRAEAAWRGELLHR